MAWSSEGGDSSDVAPTFGQPAVTAHKAHGTVPVTIESFEDIQGLGSEIAREIADAKDRLEATAFTKGTGSGQPVGIVTTVNAETSRRRAFATNSAFTATDLINIQNDLGPRFQPNASWISSLTYLNRVRALGSSSYSTWTTKLDEAVADRILGKPAYEVSDMSTALNTVTSVGFVYGDFSQYLIADRIGMAVEFVPLLHSAGNALPNGRRGWYCYWRTGADAVTNTAFVVGHVPGA
jgi:HK97 family phage major capsid protein